MLGMARRPDRKQRVIHGLAGAAVGALVSFVWWDPLSIAIGAVVGGFAGARYGDRAIEYLLR